MRVLVVAAGALLGTATGVTIVFLVAVVLTGNDLWSVM